LFYFQPYIVDIGPITITSRSFLENWNALLAKYAPGIKVNGNYPGYIDPELGDTAQLAYWGANYPQLRTVKQKWDPTDMFHNPQSVRLP
jgi:hypothetical protein